MVSALSGQVAIVTGASSGIGEALSIALAGEGVRIALAARRVSLLDRIAERIRADGGQAMSLAVDVTDDAQVEQMVARVLERWGQIDILVANAGIYVQAPTSDLTVEHLRRVMEVNFFGAMCSVLAVLPSMRERGSGHIVLMSSQATMIPIPPDGPYVASKAALSGIAQVMRQELCKEHIAVTVVSPGRIDTPLISHLRLPWISPKVSPSRLADRIVGAIRRRSRTLVYPASGYLGILRVLWPAFGDLLIRACHLQGWRHSSTDIDRSA